MILHTRAGDFDLSQRTHLMGVLNVTPDSFSDGGKFLSPADALRQAEKLIEDGADILDVGGESTRPGAGPVSVEDEMDRVVPVVKSLVKAFPKIPVSIDTVKAQTARGCLTEGASIINDVSAMQFDPDMAPVVKEFDVPVILMHRQGDPRTMQADPVYKNVVHDIAAFFQERIDFAVRAELRLPQLLLDPGIGFGKTLAHNLEIMRHLKHFSGFGLPLVIGTSRKSFIGLLTKGDEIPPPEERLEGTLISGLWSALQGAHILRVHDVKSMRRALNVWDAIARPSAG